MVTFVDSHYSNDQGESLDPEDSTVLFHEKFHHWQTIMTGYGHLKWASNRTVSSDILDAWLKYSNQIQSKPKMPLGYIFEENSMEAISAGITIYAQTMAMEMFSLKERKFNCAEFSNRNLVDEEVIAPIITVSGTQRVLNGLDIIECFAKFQESIFANFVFDIPFEKTMDITTLYEEYYIAFIYFAEQLGHKRIIEFPLICDLALQFKHIGFARKDTNWKENHPAWRFVTMVEALKNTPDIPYLDLSNIEQSSSIYIDKILSVCNFDSLDEVWKSHFEYINQTDLLFCKEMKEALNLKLKYPWILAYPFYSKDTMKKIYDFHPTAYKFSNITTFPVNKIDNNLWMMEVIFEYHLQAFVKQICGEISSYCIYRDEIQCGFTYYGLQGCEYYKTGACSGSLNVNDGLQVECCFDMESNLATGCTFGLFLKANNIDIKNIDFKDKRHVIDLDSILKEAEQLV